MDESAVAKAIEGLTRAALAGALVEARRQNDGESIGLIIGLLRGNDDEVARTLRSISAEWFTIG